VQNDTTVVNINGGDVVPSSGGYRMPLVWIDLEMTGKLFRNFFNVINTWED
jgi:oligoribonuclease